MGNVSFKGNKVLDSVKSLLTLKKGESNEKKNEVDLVSILEKLESKRAAEK